MTIEILTKTGLPLHAGYGIAPNALLTFFDMPYIKKHAHLQNTFLDIASMDMMGELMVDCPLLGTSNLWIGKMEHKTSAHIPCTFYDQLQEMIDDRKDRWSKRPGNCQADKPPQKGENGESICPATAKKNRYTFYAAELILWK